MMRQIRGIALTLLCLSPTGAWSSSAAKPRLGTRPDRATVDAGVRLGSRPRFDCLPKQTRLDQIVTYGKNGKANVTIEQTLLQMKARCRREKLVDLHNREIRFFENSCWGTPPPDAQEIRRQEARDLEKLKRRYTVIVISCSRFVARQTFHRSNRSGEDQSATLAGKIGSHGEG